MFKLDIKPPFPSRKGAEGLRQQMVDSMLRERPVAGTRLPTDDELVALSGLSHATVRRAMRLLQAQGWVDRRVGLGTFVGGRVHMPVPPAPAPAANGIRRTVRLGVISRRGEFFWQWLDHMVLQGIEQRAAELALSVELLSGTEDDIDILCRRLEQTRPDVVVSIMPKWDKFRILARAIDLRIPCLTVALRVPEFGLPGACEDGAQGMQMAVDRLVALGHRRIGLLLPEVPYAYVFDRLRGWRQGLAEAGIEVDERLVRWVELSKDWPRRIDRLRHWLASQRPTAVICGIGDLAADLGRLVASGELVVPGDLSVVVFDQDPAAAERLGCRPAHVALPLVPLGVWVAEAVRTLAAGGRDVGSAILPCDWVDGESVAAPAG